MFVSGLGCWEMGLVIPALDLSSWSWSFGPASFLMRNYVCFWTWMLGDETCHSSIGLVTLKLGFLERGHIVSGLGCWDTGLVTPASDLSSWSWAFGPASFLMRNCYCFWTWMLGHWTCHTSIGLVSLKLGLRPSFILNENLWLFLELHVGTSDLSLQRWTCHFEAGPSAQLDS